MHSKVQTDLFCTDLSKRQTQCSQTLLAELIQVLCCHRVITATDELNRVITDERLNARVA
jgi:hypothetical protein